MSAGPVFFFYDRGLDTYSIIEILMFVRVVLFSLLVDLVVLDEDKSRVLSVLFCLFFPFFCCVFVACLSFTCSFFNSPMSLFSLVFYTLSRRHPSPNFGGGGGGWGS